MPPANLRCSPLAVLVAMMLACSSEEPTTNDSNATPVPAATCTSQCSSKATSCQAPTNACAQICDGTITQAQLTCLSGKSCEELATVEQSSELAKLCPTTATTPPATGGGNVGKVGSACKCSDGAGPFECKGDNSGCEAGLVCQGQVGTAGGQCAGPRCCSGEDDCESKFGTQADCASGLKCRAAAISSSKVGYCAK